MSVFHNNVWNVCAKEYIGLWRERNKCFPYLFLLVFFFFASCIDSAVSGTYF